MISNVKCFGWKTSAKWCFSLVPWVIQIYFLMYSHSDILLVWSTHTEQLDSVAAQKIKTLRCEWKLVSNWIKKKITATLSHSCGICDNLQPRFINYETFFLITCISEIKNLIMWFKLIIDRTKSQNCKTNL